MKEYVIRDYDDHVLVIMPDGTKKVYDSMSDVDLTVVLEKERIFGIETVKKEGRNPYSGCPICKKRHNPANPCGQPRKPRRTNRELLKESLKKEES
jgi:hypothetical protein